MKVGIDARVLGSQMGGIETYVRSLIDALTVTDPAGDYDIFLDSPYRWSLPVSSHRRLIMLPPYNPQRPNPVSFPLALLRERINVVHVQNQAPLLCPTRIVVTVHDIAFERYPQFFPSERVAGLRKTVPWTIRRARAVLTVSEFSKWDIVRRYRVPAEKVVVAHGGPSPLFRPIRDEGRLRDVREKYGTGERFILCVGNLEPRKNLRRLIEAYVRLRQADTIRHKLVLVGNPAWLYDDIFAAARLSGYAEELVFTGYAPDEDVAALYNAADVFVYPSIFEGLGLPPLEAMACGTPVVTSNTSSLPEVVGDAALTVDPLDVEALAAAIARALDDGALRAELARRGPQRARAYSWEGAARTVADVYRRVAAGQRIARKDHGIRGDTACVENRRDRES